MATPTTLPASFTAGQILTAAQMNGLRGAFRVLQVVSTTKTDTFTMSGSTFTDVTDLSVTVTPSSASSKVFVSATIMIGPEATNSTYVRFMRDSTAIAVGTSTGSRIPITSGVGIGNAATPNSLAISFLDSPASTSATVYKIQVRSQGGSSVFINRTNTDTNTTDFPRGVSTITVMEISA
jgi:hypothetical protein